MGGDPGDDGQRDGRDRTDEPVPGCVASNWLGVVKRAWGTRPMCVVAKRAFYSVKRNVRIWSRRLRCAHSCLALLEGGFDAVV